MSTDQALLEKVKSDALAIPQEEIKNPEGAIAPIIEDYQNFAAKLLEDRPAFVAANRGVENIDYAQAVLHVLLLSSSDVIVGRKDVKEVLKIWEKEKPALLTIETKLMTAAWDLTYDVPELTSVVREIEEGSSNLDSIKDIFSCTKIGRRYPEHFAGITIDGETMDAAYLDKADKKAEEMLTMLNQIEYARSGSSVDIDFRNRVLVLVQRVKNQAWRDMRIVFWNKPDRKAAYYRKGAPNEKPEA